MSDTQTPYLAAIEAFNRNDITAIGSYVHSDLVYRIPGRSRVALIVPMRDAGRAPNGHR